MLKGRRNRRRTKQRSFLPSMEELIWLPPLLFLSSLSLSVIFLSVLELMYSHCLTRYPDNCLTSFDKKYNGIMG